LLSSVLRAHLSDLFPGRKTEVFSQFRLTRDSDLWVDEQDVDNLRQALRTGLETRNFGHGVRLEVSNSCPDELATILLQQFNLNESSLYRVDGPVNLVRLNQLVDLAKATRLRFSSHTPAWPRALKRNQSLFAQIRRHDVLLHHPFESFDPVMELLREAVEDPDVLSIRQTIYRTGTQSKLMELLLEAVRRGKEVTVVVELKARFDEEVNINWAEKLENLGAQVVYGVVGLKTHAKMLLITRRERRALQHYVHLSTGNYNPQTARFYTDLGLLTAHPQIAEDVMHVFVHLASQVRLPKLHQLLVAPFDLHERMVQHIQEVERAARAGKPARIIAKMNTLTDEGLIQALMSCAQAGASVDLIVRGACQLPAGVPQLTQNIRVRSIVGRFLEHSRVFYFQADAAEYMYLSSADWMSRNMFRRMEVAWPIQDAKLRQRIMQEALQMYLHDDVSAWCLKAGGDYEKVSGPEHFSVQQALLEQYKTE
jgi:polyphosphate kinase